MESPEKIQEMFTQLSNIKPIIISLSLEERKQLTTAELFELSQKYFYEADKNSMTFNIILSHKYREVYFKCFGWSIINVSNLKEMIDFIGTDVCLEIASGLGFISALLRSQNIKMITTTIVGSYYNEEEMANNIWADTELINAVDAIKKYKECNCLLLSWGNGILYNILSYYRGQKLIIIGGYGGCTDYLSDKDVVFKLIKEIAIPKWWGLRDKMFFYERND